MANSNEPVSTVDDLLEEPISDGSLLRRLQGGEEDAARQLYYRYVYRLQALTRGKCSAQLSQREDAEDIVQSVFRTFFLRARLGHYDVPAGEDLWNLLMVIAINKIRTKGAFHRAAKRDVRRAVPVDYADPGVARQLGEDTAEDVFCRMAVDEVLEQLEPRQQELVRLRLEGHEVAEIAELTGRSKRTVERNLQDIRNRLKRLQEQDQ